MKNANLIASIFFLLVLVTSCKQPQEARRPVSQSSGSFMKKSIIRNKKLVADEETQIKNLIKSNPNIQYTASTKGYWYSYQIQNKTDSLTPKKGDVAFFDYEITDLKGAIIYSELELRPQVYYVDKQNIMMGLRDGIKLMHKGEKINFIFPSNMGYGYRGDEKKIGMNQPIICIVTLRDFKSEVAFKKETQIKIKPVTSAPLLIEQKKTVEKTPNDTIN
jgi:gliding motility-associated peptidyl-prolyl isomerase